MKDGLRFVDCDMHIMEPPDLFTRYLDPKFRDRVILPIGANGRVKRGTIVIALTQSGETADTLAALRESRRKGHPTLALCNVVGSSIAREADGGVYLHAGPEVGVASTKAFTNQLAVLAMLALYFGRLRHLSSLQGQRIISTTGIKCVGNTVLLQGVPYAPPYEIVAVGNPTEMYGALINSPQVLAYRADVARYNLGWELEERSDASVPPYAGTPDLDFARAVGSGN